MVLASIGRVETRRRTPTSGGRGAVLAAVLAVALVAAGCEGMTTSQKGATAGAALGSGIALVTGAGVATTVGAGLIGGAAGYLGGELVGNK
jgi:hypothetical protein